VIAVSLHIKAPPERRFRMICGVMVLGLLWALAFVLRWRLVGEVNLGSDAIGPFLAALSAQIGHLPNPPNPEGGHSLWWVNVPLVHLATSLENLFVLRMAVSALVAPVGALAAWVWLDGAPLRTRWAGMIIGGLLLVADPGLLHTGVMSFTGYGGPEWIALATLGLALAERGKGWGASLAAFALVTASGQHPMAFGAVLGVILMRPWRRWERRVCVSAVLVGLVFAVPRLVHVVRIASCGEGPLACLGGVALGSTEPSGTIWGMVYRAFHDRFVVESGLLWVGLLLAALLCLLPHKKDAGPRCAPALAWAIGVVVGVALVGLSVDSFRSYHLRHAAAPIAVAVAVGVARWWPAGVALAAWALQAALTLPTSGPEPGAVYRTDALARSLGTLADPLWVDGLWYSGPARLEPSAVVLSAVLQGQRPDRFDVGADVQVLLLVNGVMGLEAREGVEPTLHASGEDWQALLFSNMWAASTWVAHGPDPQRSGGAYDWLTALHPLEADLARTDWPSGK
jgi:hypothetical protein